LSTKPYSGLVHIEAEGKNPHQGKQTQWLMKVHFLDHRSMALEITKHSLRSDLLVFDEPGAKINEQSFGSHYGRNESYD
jgi:hypothetical protein